MNNEETSHLKEKRILIFDGFCELCSRSISFLKKNLKNHYYLFVPSKNEDGIQLIDDFNLGDIPNHSIVLIKNDNIFTKSDAILEIIDDMTAPWKLLKILKLIPRIIRNWIYDLISKYRHSFRIRN